MKPNQARSNSLGTKSLLWGKFQHFKIQNKAASEQQEAFKYSLFADTVLLSDCGG